MCPCIYVSLYLCIYVLIYSSIYVYWYKCMYVCVYILCMYVILFTYVCASICLRVSELTVFLELYSRKTLRLRIDPLRSGVVSSLSSVLPTSQVFTSGYVNTETILHFFYKITNERGTKHSAKLVFIKLIKITILPKSPPSNQNCPLKTGQELSSPSKKPVFVEMQWMRLIDISETNASTRNVKRKSK